MLLFGVDSVMDTWLATVMPATKFPMVMRTMTTLPSREASLVGHADAKVEELSDQGSRPSDQIFTSKPSIPQVSHAGPQSALTVLTRTSQAERTQRASFGAFGAFEAIDLSAGTFGKRPLSLEQHQPSFAKYLAWPSNSIFLFLKERCWPL
jgi:hypothetical protein